MLESALQCLLPPEPMHPLVVHRPALEPQHAVRHPPTPADELSCNLSESLTQLGLLDLDNLADLPLGAAVLAHHLAGKQLRAQKFRSTSSLSIPFSNSASARSYLKRTFSFSSLVRRLDS